ncbi:MAG: glycosyltransferase family 2 protein [Gilvibacter sp.]
MNISVYITSYNQKEFLKEAIQSVLNQTLPPFEIIVVDDASTDGSQELIKEYAIKHNIRYVFHEQNMGVTQARLTALQNVKGDYVTYVDGDDVYLENKLEVESNIIKKQKCDIAFSNNAYVLEQNLDAVQWVWMEQNQELDVATNVFLKTLTRDFPRSSLFRMELVNYQKLKEIGFHDPKLNIYEDYDLRIRLARHCSFGYSTAVTSKVRISKAGLSKSHAKLHLSSLKYIFNKYSDEIERLSDPVKKEVNFKLAQILELYTPATVKNHENSFFSKVKRGIKKIFS